MISKLYWRGDFNRSKLITECCKGKKVLDLGVVQHNARYEEAEDWVHKNIKKAAKELVGIDIDEKGIRILNEKGYNIKFANAEHFDLHDTFDVIVAGELIEHLNNVGLFLECVRRHMRKDSIFILTTPNCTSLYNLVNFICSGKVTGNIEHTHWYDDCTIKRVLENHGFEIIELSFVIPHAFYKEEKIFAKVLRALRHTIHVLFCCIQKKWGPIIFVAARLRN